MLFILLLPPIFSHLYFVLFWKDIASKGLEEFPTTNQLSPKVHDSLTTIVKAHTVKSGTKSNTVLMV